MAAQAVFPDEVGYNSRSTRFRQRLSRSCLTGRLGAKRRANAA